MTSGNPAGGPASSPAGTSTESAASSPVGNSAGSPDGNSAGQAAGPPAGSNVGSTARRLVGAVTRTRPPTTGSVPATRSADRGVRAPADPAAARRGPRRARLALRRIDPWSVLKVAFLLSLALLVVFIVAVAVLYLVLDTLGVFSSIDSALQQVSPSTDSSSVTDVFSFARAIGGTAVLGTVNVLLFTALATLGAFLYNLCAAIAGGIEVTLTE